MILLSYKNSVPSEALRLVRERLCRKNGVFYFEFLVKDEANTHSPLHAFLFFG